MIWPLRTPKPPNSYLALVCYAHAHAQATLDTSWPQVLVSPTPSQSWPGSTFTLLVHLPGLVSDQLFLTIKCIHGLGT
nr:hypothetical protein Iba_chr11aCG2100 [Ipomoea batatas]GMD56262.1 hypothetical protein Iba_chr11eCG1480 [Ipomoea batatas]